METCSTYLISKTIETIRWLNEKFKKSVGDEVKKVGTFFNSN